MFAKFILSINSFDCQPCLIANNDQSLVIALFVIHWQKSQIVRFDNCKRCTWPQMMKISQRSWFDNWLIIIWQNDRPKDFMVFGMEEVITISSKPNYTITNKVSYLHKKKRKIGKISRCWQNFVIATIIVQ